MSRSFLSIALTCAFVALGSIPSQTATAQRRSSSSAVMGRGISAYYSGQSAEAEQQLSTVINAGSRDPLAYYFRALARLNQGRQYEAEQDMQLGAAFESRNAGASRQISRALMRVQGTHRRTLEKYRREGRLTASSVATQDSQTRAHQLQSRETYVLRKPVVVPVEGLLEPSSVEIITADSYVVPGSYVEVAPNSQRVAPPVVVEQAPTQQPPTSAPPAVVDNAFAMPAETPQPTAPSPAPEPQVEDELFATETPFGEETVEEPVAEPVTEPAPATPDKNIANEELDNLFESPKQASTPEPATTPAEVDPFDQTASEFEEAVESEPSGFFESLEPADEPVAESTPVEPPMAAEPTPVAEEKPAAEEIPEPVVSKQPAEQAELPESSKVESKKLMRVLGRVVGEMVPKPNISLPEGLPSMLPGAAVPPVAEEPEAGFDLGPGDAFDPVEPVSPQPEAVPSQPEAVAAPAAKPAEEVDQLFGKTGSDEPEVKKEAVKEEAAEEAAEDFGLFEDSAETAPAEAEPAESASQEVSAEEETAEEATETPAAEEEPAEEESSEAEPAEAEPAEEASSDSETEDESDDDPFGFFEE